jgi:ubiquinone/menaquinone biosynthesis C-methylase UbiE
VEHLNQLTACPVCEHTETSNHLVLKDWMITKETFTIVRCNSCGFHYTNPIPSESVIGNYYKSEEYVSHSSSNKGLINRVYNIVRNYTLKQKVALVGRYAKGKSILEVGSGTGHFLNAAKLSGYQVEGLEPDTDARNFAQSNFNLSLNTLDHLTAIPSNSKDVVTMWHVLEHVYHLKRDLNEIVRTMKSGGVFFIAVPNMSSWDAQHYKEYWAAYDVPRHLYHFQENTIKKLIETFGLVHKDTLPMKFDSYYVSMLSEKYKGGSALQGIINGFKSNLQASQFGYSSQIYVFVKE